MLQIRNNFPQMCLHARPIPLGHLSCYCDISCFILFYFCVYKYQGCGNTKMFYLSRDK